MVNPYKLRVCSVTATTSLGRLWHGPCGDEVSWISGVSSTHRRKQVGQWYRTNQQSPECVVQRRHPSNHIKRTRRVEDRIAQVPKVDPSYMYAEHRAGNTLAIQLQGTRGDASTRRLTSHQPEGSRGHRAFSRAESTHSSPLALVRRGAIAYAELCAHAAEYLDGAHRSPGLVYPLVGHSCAGSLNQNSLAQSAFSPSPTWRA